MVALYMFAYSFIKPPGSRRSAPPVAIAGAADQRRKVEDIVSMLDAEYEATRPRTRGPYKKKGSRAAAA